MGPIYLVGTIPRSIRICVPNVVMIGPAVWPPILDRQTDRHTHTHTDRQNLYYIDIDIRDDKISLNCLPVKNDSMNAVHQL